MNFSLIVILVVGISLSSAGDLGGHGGCEGQCGKQFFYLYINLK